MYHIDAIFNLLRLYFSNHVECFRLDIIFLLNALFGYVWTEKITSVCEPTLRPSEWGKQLHYRALDYYTGDEPAYYK